MWWFFIFLFFPILPIYAEHSSKNNLESCKQCTCIKEDSLLKLNWNLLRVSKSIFVLLSHDLSEKEAKEQEARDRELNHGVNNHFEKNYNNYETWAQTLSIKDYSAFCTKEIYCRRSVTIELTQESYLQHSETLLFALEYDKAIDLLTEAIQKYPDNKELYEKRIFAYLELGRLNDAVKDFIANDFEKELRADPAKAALALAFLKGASTGVFEGVKEYPLSMLYSLRGTGQMLWAAVSDPMGVPSAIIEDLENAISILREGDISKILEKIAPELHDVVAHWDDMDQALKWEKLGHILAWFKIG